MNTRAITSCLFALASAGCFTVNTTEVKVRDPAQVSLERPDHAPLLPRGAQVAVVDRGEFWYFLSREPYELLARRERTGAIELRCDVCDAPYPLSGRSSLALLDESGRTLAAPTWSVDVDPRIVAVSLDWACMVGDPDGFCRVPVHARLAFPTSDVVEVRRRVEPVRPWGYMLLGASALAIAAATWYALTPSQGESIGDRLPWAVGFALPFVALGGVGLWQLLAPAREQVWTPPSSR